MSRSQRPRPFVHSRLDLSPVAWVGSGSAQAPVLERSSCLPLRGCPAVGSGADAFGEELGAERGEIAFLAQKGICLRICFSLTMGRIAWAAVVPEPGLHV